MAERVSSEQFEAGVLKADRPVLVDFYSDSCVPCKRLVPQLSKLEAARGEALGVVKVNTNFDMDLAQRYGVMATPTLVLFRDGAELARETGFKRLPELEAFVDGALG